MIKERRNTVFFDFDLDKSDPAFDALVNQLRPDIEDCFNKLVIAKGLHIAHLKLILLNLLKADCQDSHPSVVFSRNRDDYYPQKPHKQGLKVRPDILIPIIDVLAEFDYLEEEPGSNAGVLAKRYRSKMWATDKLRALFQPVQNLFPAEPPNYIILRDKKQKLIHFNHNEATRRMNENLIFINQVLGQHSITLSEEGWARMEAAKKRQDSNVDSTQIKLVRIFKETFEQEGRFYGGWWEYLPKDYRSYIRIDGEETVLLDFTGTIVNLIYLECGLTPPEGDVYTVPSALPGSRKFQKRAMQMILNNSSRQRASQALSRYIYKENWTARKSGKVITVNNTGLTEYQLLADLEKKHQLIQHMLYRNIGIKFHRIESDIAEDVLMILTRKGIPVLPIHDGFIVKITDKNELAAAMTKACNTRYGKAMPFKAE